VWFWVKHRGERSNLVRVMVEKLSAGTDDLGKSTEQRGRGCKCIYDALINKKYGSTIF
jgi:hypothetical protein